MFMGFDLRQTAVGRCRPYCLSSLLVMRHPEAVCARSLAEGEQRVVTLHKVVAQIGAAPRPVITIAHLAVAQMQHECTFVDDVQPHQPCGICGQGRKQEKEQ